MQQPAISNFCHEMNCNRCVTGCEQVQYKAKLCKALLLKNDQTENVQPMEETTNST
jgi:hypothetical protein